MITVKLTVPRAILPCAPLDISLARSHIQGLLLLVLVRATIGCGCDASPVTTSAATVKGSSRFRDRRDVSQRKLPHLLSGEVGHEFNVTTDGANAARGHTLDPTLDANRATPPVWRSTLCMEQWGMSIFQEKPDPNGYVIYVNGRQGQMSGEKLAALFSRFSFLRNASVEGVEGRKAV